MDHFFVVVHSDFQCGLRFGLAMPWTKLPVYDEAGDVEKYEKIKLSATGTQLAKWFADDAKKASALIKDEEWYHLFIGDATHGTRVGLTLYSDRMADQLLIARDCFSDWYGHMKRPPSAVRLVKGSGMHVMNEGTAELLLAQSLRDGGLDAEAWHQAVLTLGGLDIDIAHKGPKAGEKIWVEGDEVRRYIRSEVMKHVLAGQEPPDLFLRGHYHDRMIEDVHLYTWSGTYRAWGGVCPAYAIVKDDYTRSVMKSKSHMTAGTLVVEVVDEEILKIHDFTHYVDLRRKETLR